MATVRVIGATPVSARVGDPVGVVVSVQTAPHATVVFWPTGLRNVEWLAIADDRGVASARITASAFGPQQVAVREWSDPWGRPTLPPVFFELDGR